MYAVHHSDDLELERDDNLTVVTVMMSLWQNEVKRVERELSEHDDEIDRESPPAREANTLQLQLNNMQVVTYLLLSLYYDE